MSTRPAEMARPTSASVASPPHPPTADSGAPGLMAVVIGASAGGLEALRLLVGAPAA